MSKIFADALAYAWDFRRRLTNASGIFADARMCIKDFRRRLTNSSKIFADTLAHVNDFRRPSSLRQRFSPTLWQTLAIMSMVFADF